MKNSKKILQAVSLSAVLSLGCILPVACDGGSAKLVIEGQKSVFYIGDEFTTGEDFKVYYESNGKRKDVTADVTISYESTFNMNEPGDYGVTVNYGKKKEVYYIMVNTFNNTLTKITADASKAKVNYQVGESISYDGLKVIGTYKNERDVVFEDAITSFNSLKFSIVSENGVQYEDAFTVEGTHTVSIASGSFATAYTVTVSGVNLESVQSGIALGKYFKKNVASGTATVYAYIDAKGNKSQRPMSYLFGDNYTYVKDEDLYDTSEYHLSVGSDGKTKLAFFYSGVQVDRTAIPNMINGPQFLPWYNDSDAAAYGIEQLIEGLYNVGVKNPNQDYTENVDEDTQTFTFSFGRMNELGNTRHYYWETEVTFTLGESYFIQSATIEQKTWLSSDTNNPPYKNFVTDETTGITRPAKENADYIWTVECSQVAGARTEKNPYYSEEEEGGEAGVVKDYRILFQGEEIADGDTINIEQGNADANGHFNQFTIKFDNIEPSDANFKIDTLYVNDGTANKIDAFLWYYGQDFIVYGSWLEENSCIIEPLRGGLCYLELTTRQTKKVIWFNVVGADPTSLTSRVYNPLNKFENNVSEKTVGVEEAVYFTCLPNDYANGAFTATVGSGNSSAVVLTPPSEDPEQIAADPTLKYWKFSATAAGTYVIRMTSTVAPSVSTTLTITVNEIDFANVLHGSYTAEDSAGYVYSVSFTPDQNGGTEGKVSFSYIEKGSDETFQTVVYEYSVQHGAVVIGERISGDTDLGIKLTVTAENKIILIDKYSQQYELERVI